MLSYVYINALAWLSRQYFCWIQIGTEWKKYIGSDINRFAYLGFVMLFLCWRWLFCFRYLQVIPCTGLGGDCAVWSIKVWWIGHPHKKYAGSVSSCCLQTCFIQFPDRSHLDQLDAPQLPSCGGREPGGNLGWIAWLKAGAMSNEVLHSR